MSASLLQEPNDDAAHHLMVTVAVWNHCHHLDTDGRGWFSYVSGVAWEAVLCRLLALSRGVEGATVRFFGEGVDPSARRANFAGGAVLDSEAAKSAVCLVEVVDGKVDELRTAFSALLEGSGLAAGWFMPSPVGVVHLPGADRSMR